MLLQNQQGFIVSLDVGTILILRIADVGGSDMRKLYVTSESQCGLILSYLIYRFLKYHGSVTSELSTGFTHVRLATPLSINTQLGLFHSYFSLVRNLRTDDDDDAS